MSIVPTTQLLYLTSIGCPSWPTGQNTPVYGANYSEIVKIKDHISCVCMPLFALGYNIEGTGQHNSRTLCHGEHDCDCHRNCKHQQRRSWNAHGYSSSYGRWNCYIVRDSPGLAPLAPWSRTLQVALRMVWSSNHHHLSSIPTNPTQESGTWLRAQCRRPSTMTRSCASSMMQMLHIEKPVLRYARERSTVFAYSMASAADRFTYFRRSASWSEVSLAWRVPVVGGLLDPCDICQPDAHTCTRKRHRCCSRFNSLIDPPESRGANDMIRNSAVTESPRFYGCNQKNLTWIWTRRPTPAMWQLECDLRVTSPIGTKRISHGFLIRPVVAPQLGSWGVMKYRLPDRPLVYERADKSFFTILPRVDLWCLCQDLGRVKVNVKVKVEKGTVLRWASVTMVSAMVPHLAALGPFAQFTLNPKKLLCGCSCWNNELHKGSTKDLQSKRRGGEPPHHKRSL